MANFNWSAFVVSQLWNVPFLFVYLTGIVLAIVFWRRHSVVSILAILAFLLLSGNLMVGAGLQFWQMSALERGSGIQEISTVLGIAGAVRAVLGLIAWALVLTALFGWRATPVSSPGVR